MRAKFIIYFIFSQCFFASLTSDEIITSQVEPKVVLITGASRGIGWETAKKLANDGHRVYASMRSLSSFDQNIDNLPPSLFLLEMDITEDSSIARAFNTLSEKEGRLDVLINNAGCAVFGPVELVTVEQAKKTFEVNFFGTMRMIQAALPVMREQNKGLIINLSSTSGIRPSPGWDIYGASKFAIEGLSEAVAAMVRHWNIYVVLLEPGTTSTDFMEKSTEIGNRKATQTAVYQHFLPNAVKWMQDRLADGQDPAEVAEVISLIIAEDAPKLRYQTSAKGKQTVASRHCDPTGEKSVAEQQQLIRQLWNGPLEANHGSSYR